MASVPCDINQVGKRRDGKPRFWCSAHGANATGKYGTRLDKCESAHLHVDLDDCFELDVEKFPGGVGVWGAVKPVYDTTSIEDVCGVHVHARLSDDGEKVIDRTFPALFLKYRRDLLDDGQAIITGDAAVAFFVSRVLGHEIGHLYCTHCAELHLDADYFAVKPHKKHLCHKCGKNFLDSRKSISNPISFFRQLGGDSENARQVQRATETLDIRQSDFPGGLKIWASNPALLWTRVRPEQQGIHVHAHAPNSDDTIINDTFAKVVIDGIEINEAQTRQYMAQSALCFLHRKVVSIECPECSSPHFDEGEDGFLPHKNHTCKNCGASFVTPLQRKLVVSNPIISDFEALYEIAGGERNK